MDEGGEGEAGDRFGVGWGFEGFWVRLGFWVDGLGVWEADLAGFFLLC